MPGRPPAPGLLEPGTGRWVQKWDPKMSIEICEDVAGGKTLAESCGPKTPGRVKPATFLHWCLTVPELGAVYKLAREISGHMMEDEAVVQARRLIDMKEPTATGVRAIDVAMNQLRWSAAKRNPKEYSDKAALTFTVPIQINTSLPLSPGDDTRGEAPNEAFIVDLQAEQVPQPPPEDLEEGTKKRTFYDAAREAVGQVAGPGAGKGAGWRKGLKATTTKAEVEARQKEKRHDIGASTNKAGIKQNKARALRRGAMAGREERELVDQGGEPGVLGPTGGPLPDPGVGGQSDQDRHDADGNDQSGQGGG